MTNKLKEITKKAYNGLDLIGYSNEELRQALNYLDSPECIYWCTSSWDTIESQLLFQEEKEECPCLYGCNDCIPTIPSNYNDQLEKNYNSSYINSYNSAMERQEKRIGYLQRK